MRVGLSTATGVFAVLLALAVFALLFVVADQAYVAFADSRFPTVGDSVALATLWGLVSRAHLILPALALVLWSPRLFGFQLGDTRDRLPMLAGMLLVNCTVVAAFLLLSGPTPFSGNQWLLTEVVIVPLVEETVWRGIVLSLVALMLRRFLHERAAWAVAIWSVGVTFGLLHLGNALTGAPLGFVLVQATSAIVWGVMYGYARMATRSVYPPMILHAAMNLVVALF